MKQKIIKYQSDLFKGPLIVTIDENLNKLKGKTFAPLKLAATNETLNRLKHVLPNKK